MRDAGQRLTSLVRVSVSQAYGFTPLSLQVSISDAIVAQLEPPSSLPGEQRFFPVQRDWADRALDGIGAISMRPSSRKRDRPSQRPRP